MKTETRRKQWGPDNREWTESSMATGEPTDMQH